MAKIRISFVCGLCRHSVPKWVGCCPGCQEWNTMEEQQVASGTNQQSRSLKSTAPQLRKLEDISTTEAARMCTGIEEWDRVMGGGILPGSFLMLTGDPGIGKSTLLLHVAHILSTSHRVFYFSSEESLAQVKNRASRIGCTNSQLLLSDISSLAQIIACAQEEKPDLIILDSIQNCFLSDEHVIPGSIAQLREAAFHLMRLAKEHTIAVLTTGHITKDGHMAGPKILEHMVDGVFYLQGEDRWQTRILRSVKNRFGTIHETGFFEMEEDGMREVRDINKLLLADSAQVPGASLVTSIEGTRPILVELQALCVASKFGMPQRVVTGIDPKRVVLIAAILEKYLHVKLSSHDIFFKVSGNFKIKESGIDLGIALALLSSYFQKPLPERSISMAELSLTGQVKPINQVGIRAREAEKFGLSTIITARSQQLQTSCKIMSFRNVYELLNLFPED